MGIGAAVLTVASSGSEFPSQPGNPSLNLLDWFNTHRIHVWYINLHLVDLYGKCR